MQFKIWIMACLITESNIGYVIHLCVCKKEWTPVDSNGRLYVAPFLHPLFSFKVLSSWSVFPLSECTTYVSELFWADNEID